MSREQWNFSNSTRNLEEDADQIITSLQNIEFENNEFILKLRFIGRSTQVQETKFILSKQNARSQHQQSIVTNLMQLLSNIRLSQAAQERPLQQSSGHWCGTIEASAKPLQSSLSQKLLKLPTLLSYF